MRIILTFKTPDVKQELQDQINEVGDALTEESNPEKYDELQKKAMNLENFEAFIDKFVKYGEIIFVEFDSDAKTVKVLEVK